MNSESTSHKCVCQVAPIIRFIHFKDVCFALNKTAFLSMVNSGKSILSGFICLTC